MPTEEETAEAIELVRVQGHDVVMAFLNQLSATGEDWIPLTDSDPYGGAAREIAALWDSRIGGMWDACAAQGACSVERGGSDAAYLAELGGQRAQVRAGSDTSQVFPLGNRRWLAYGVYRPVGHIFTDSNLVTDFVFFIDSGSVVLDDMVVWTQSNAVNDSRGIWLSDLVYGPAIASVDPRDGIEVSTVRGAIGGPLSDNYAQILYLQFETTAIDDYSFSGMRDHVPQGSWTDDMRYSFSEFKAMSDNMWSSIWPAAADPGETITMGYHQSDPQLRMISDPHTLNVSGFGVVTIGDENLTRPGYCRRRNVDEAPTWMLDRQLWTCLAWADYDPSAVD